MQSTSESMTSEFQWTLGGVSWGLLSLKKLHGSIAEGRVSVITEIKPYEKTETFTIEKRVVRRAHYGMIYLTMPPDTVNRKFRITVEEIEE